MEPVMDVEKVPKQRWKLVSALPSSTLKFLANNRRIVTFANSAWELASSAVIRTALSPSM